MFGPREPAPTVAVPADERAYYRRRGQQEEEAARTAASRAAAKLHLELARRYRQLAEWAPSSSE